MKVGVITFQTTTNYGACLQNVALNRVINGLGVDCETIDYKCEAIDKRELPHIPSLKAIVFKPFSIIAYLLKLKKFKRIELFKKQWCLLSSVQYNKTNIFSANKYYSSFISGSDIIWEMGVTSGDCNYMLSFADSYHKKYSFSSSFGYDSIPSQYLDDTKKYLCLYSNISVRENEGKILVSSLTGKDIEVTLDPTLLLNKKQWMKMEKPFRKKRDYVFLYFDDADHNCLKKAKSLANEHGLSIIYLSDSLRKTKGTKTVRAIEVGQFIWLIRNAKYVVTGSYHGVVFSINFNVPFFFYNRNHSSRINTIVNNLCITNKDLANNVVDSSFDWKNINDRLNVLRGTSINYLKGICDEINKSN